MEWWCDVHYSLYAQCYLAATATSVQTEHLFSSTAAICCD